jgi:tetratricopeptide (TPR) repeat protein
MSSHPVIKNRLTWLAPLSVAALTFAVFLPALNCGFVNWDDVYNLVENQAFRGLGPAQLKWMFTTFYMGPYQPLSWVSFGLDYLAWGMNPFGYHLTSVLLHSANALLFYLLCLRLLAPAGRSGAPAEAAELRLAAAFAALLFSVHPLRVESVAWVTERRDVLCGFFYLLTILCYLPPRQPGAAAAPYWRRHLLPLAAFLLALLSKGMAVSLPVVLLVLDVYPLKRLPARPGLWFSRENRQVWLEKLPYFALAAVFGAIGYAYQANAGALASYEKAGFSARAAQILFAVVFYLRKTLVPAGLSPLYQLPAGFGLLNLPSLFSAAVLAAATAAAVALRRRWPAVAAVWACYLATLSPVAGAVKFGFQSAADRYTYLPCLGFALLAGAGLLACRRAAGKRLGRLCALAACLAIAALAGLAWRQQGVWKNSETLWTRALEVNPGLDLAHNNLGHVLAAQGRLGEAEGHYRQALRLNPDSEFAHYNLGIILGARGETAAAAGHYLEVLRVNPGFAEAHNGLCRILSAQGKYDAAAARCREALRLNPSFVPARLNLGFILATQGRDGEAAEQYLAALRLSPGSVEAHYNLGGLLAAQGRQDEAAEHYRAALRADPAFGLARAKLALLRAGTGATR